MKELLKAIAKTQDDLGGVIGADTKGVHNKFAKLEHVLSTIIPAATKNGLIVIQAVDSSDLGPVLKTTVCGETQILTWAYPLIPDKPGVQELGKAITYSRRYSLLTIFGLATVDDPDLVHPPVPKPTRVTMPDFRSAGSQPANPQPKRRWQDLEIFCGSSKGKRLGEVPYEDAIGLRNWLVDKNKKDKKELAGKALEYCQAVNAMESEFTSPMGFAEVDPDEVPF